MLHIATIRSMGMLKECRYKQRAGWAAAYYAMPMSLRIAELRKERGLSQDDLASKSGISRSQLAQIETESRPANTLRLNAIAKALNVEAWQLFSIDSYGSAILDIIPKLAESDQKAILRMAEALASQDQPDS